MTSTPTTIQERVPLPPAGEMAMPQVSKSITPADVLAILKQRLVTIIVLSILFGGIAIGVFALLFTKYPVTARRPSSNARVMRRGVNSSFPGASWPPMHIPGSCKRRH